MTSPNTPRPHHSPKLARRLISGFDFPLLVSVTLLRVAIQFIPITPGLEMGSADTVRDPRGFAVKFYTELGNWDLVGNNTPIFFLRDPIFFPSFIHTQKRNPRTHLRDPNMMWDFQSLRPETTHQVRRFPLFLHVGTMFPVVIVTGTISGGSLFGWESKDLQEDTFTISNTEFRSLRYEPIDQHSIDYNG